MACTRPDVKAEDEGIELGVDLESLLQKDQTAADEISIGNEKDSALIQEYGDIDLDYNPNICCAFHSIYFSFVMRNSWYRRFIWAGWDFYNMAWYFE